MELLSVLIITFSVSGSIHESELPMASHQCEAAQHAIARAIKGPRKSRPSVELHNGAKVPVRGATCVHGCFADGLPELELVSTEERRNERS